MAAAAAAVALLSGAAAQAAPGGAAAAAGTGQVSGTGQGATTGRPGGTGQLSGAGRGSAAGTRSAAAALIARARAALAAPSDTGASDIVNLGGAGWRVASSATATQPGAAISEPGFDAGSWLPVTNDDAGAPGTEIEALLQNGVCPGHPGLRVNQGSDSRQSVFYSANMKTCFGYMSRIGPDTVPRFAVPWWWRTDFSPRLHQGGRAELIVNGVVGAAAVWVNGREVATPATVTGAYTRFAFDVTRLLRPGTNTVAIEVQPNNPNKMFTVNDVDWNQNPAGQQHRHPVPRPAAGGRPARRR